MSSAMYLHQLIEDWIRSSPHIRTGWICDEAMIWKPFHRYWFGINNHNIEMHDTMGGPVAPNMDAADPEFIDKLDYLLVKYV